LVIDWLYKNGERKKRRNITEYYELILSYFIQLKHACKSQRYDFLVFLNDNHNGVTIADLR